MRPQLPHAPGHSDAGSPSVTLSLGLPLQQCLSFSLVLFLHGQFPWPLVLEEVIWHFACFLSFLLGVPATLLLEASFSALSGTT